MTKKVLIAVLACCLLFTGLFAGLAACTTNNTDTSADSSATSDTAGTSSDQAATDSTTPVATTPGPVTFTDDLGNTVTVNNPQRVVATMGSFAKIWELAGGTLIGASDDAYTYSGYDLTSPDITKVGDFSSLNMETILSLNPDFVIMTGAAAGRPGMAAQTDYKDTLEASGITVAYFVVTDFSDYLHMLNICTQITGRADLYKTNGTDVQSRIDAITATVPADAANKRVIIMTTYSGGVMVQNSSTQTGAILSDLGVTNIADSTPSLLSNFSLEALIATDPDYIFVVPMAVNMDNATQFLDDATSNNPAWSQLSAVQDGHYIVLDPGLFQYKPNENWDQSYQVLYDYLFK
ncbi:MAG: ABC transporter substrate-binding protein [Coriobacteriia bacterium]|nr:ABC transporter substrate-binding protein [Coriobacteriia bacterium]